MSSASSDSKRKKESPLRDCAYSMRRRTKSNAVFEPTSSNSSSPSSPSSPSTPIEHLLPHLEMTPLPSVPTTPECTTASQQNAEAQIATLQNELEMHTLQFESAVLSLGVRMKELLFQSFAERENAQKSTEEKFKCISDENQRLRTQLIKYQEELQITKDKSDYSLRECQEDLARVQDELKKMKGESIDELDEVKLNQLLAKQQKGISKVQSKLQEVTKHN
jgi:hypothetical protein